MLPLTRASVLKTIKAAKARNTPITEVRDLAEAMGISKHRVYMFLARHKMHAEIGMSEFGDRRIKGMASLAYWHNHGISALAWLQQRLESRGETAFEAANRIRTANGKLPLLLQEVSPKLAPSNEDVRHDIVEHERA